MSPQDPQGEKKPFPAITTLADALQVSLERRLEQGDEAVVQTFENERQILLGFVMQERLQVHLLDKRQTAYEFAAIKAVGKMIPRHHLAAMVSWRLLMMAAQFTPEEKAFCDRRHCTLLGVWAGVIGRSIETWRSRLRPALIHG